MDFNWIRRLLPAAIRRRLRGSSTLQKIVENTSWLMFERVVNMTIRFFVGVWVVRYLGPEQYGVYSYALSLVGMFTAFSTLGLDNIVVRSLSHEQGEDGVISTALTLRLGAAVATMALVTAIAFSTSDDWITQLCVVVISGQLIFKAADVFDLWFQSQIKSKYPVWVRSGVTVLYAGAQVACILAGFGVVAFAGLVMAQTALQTIGTYLIYRAVGEQERKLEGFEWGSAKSIMKDAWPLMFSGLAVAAYMKVDQVMLGSMIGKAEVGIYATAAKISELWYFIPTAIAGSVFPKIVEMKKENSSDYKKNLQTYFDLIALVSYVVIVPVTAFSEIIILTIFGSEYKLSSFILQIHIWSFIFVALGVSRSKWLIAENMTGIALFTTALGAVSNILLNVFLIPAYGGVGAAWATLVSYSIYCYFSLAILPQTRKMFVRLTKSLFIMFRINKIIKKV
jgi:PST family polysaccharide transporter